MLFDSHAHLDDEAFDADRDEVIARALSNGLAGMVNPGSCMKSSAAALALAEQHAAIYAAVGIHPHDADSADEAAYEQLLQWSRHPKVVAIGEIGLDYHYDFSPREAQREAFANQLDLALAAKKPVIIHDREAHGDVMAMVSARKGRLGGVLHCYSGSYEDAVRYIDMGFYIAFGGALTFKNATKQRAIAEKLPLERLVIETDCPYMTPEPHRGERNSPLLIHLTLEMLASVRGISMEEAAAATYQNAMDLFGISL